MTFLRRWTISQIRSKNNLPKMALAGPPSRVQSSANQTFFEFV